MDDEEFKNAVIGALGSLESKIDDIRQDMETEQRHLDHRLDAIVSRLEEQDSAYDRLNEKVDRLGLAVRQALEAGEQALNAITPLSRRVTRLESRGNEG